jgi:effector-binding domain-containing protein
MQTAVFRKLKSIVQESRTKPKEGDMSYKFEVKEQPAQPTLAIRRRTSVEELPQVMGSTYGAVAQYLGELGEQPAGPPFAVYYNDDMQDLDVEIGFPVARDLPGRGDIQASEIPGGKVATCLYVGPYEDIEQPYNALGQWMGEHGYEATGLVYEMYLNDPQETPPEELQTQIVFLLK